MRIVVTGGGGFIGRATIAAAQRAGHEARTFDKHEGLDVQDRDALDRVLAGGHAVIHLAGVLGTAELFETPHAAVDINVHGTLNVLEAASAHGLSYVGITMPPVFPSVYTATKVCADRLATAWHYARDLPTSHVRAFNAYGPGQAHGVGHPQKILPTFATCGWRNQPIPVWGDGEQTVDLIHADDLARMLVDAVTCGGDDITFDGGTGVAMTVNDVARMVLDITGSEAGIDYLPMRDGELPTTIIAKGDGWDRLGWAPEHDPAKFAKAVKSYRAG